MWVGTKGGALSRFHEDSWQVFNIVNSSLASDWIWALEVGHDGRLWIGSGRESMLLSGTIGDGLTRYDKPPAPVIKKIETLKNISQREHTFAVRAFDPSLRTPSHLLRYEWAATSDSEKTITKTQTGDPYFRMTFPGSGKYSITVRAINNYGWPSNREVFDVNVELPTLSRSSWWDSPTILVSAIVPILYVVLLIPLVALYPRYSLARSLVNSGFFSRFPVVHRILLNTSWARRQLFDRYLHNASTNENLTHYIDQSVSTESGSKSEIGSSEDPLATVAEQGRFSVILGRSGTGKSVLMKRLFSTVATRFNNGLTQIPVLLNAPIHLPGAESLSEAIKLALRREGNLELPDSALDYLLRKGGFLVLIDSLNEYPDARQKIVDFINADPNNYLLVASQTDLLRHPDVKQYRLRQVTDSQAREYVDARVGTGTWVKLSDPMKALAHNPKDLNLIVDVILNLGTDKLPTRRAALYAERLRADSAIENWVEVADPRLSVLYEIAWRLVTVQSVMSYN